MRFGDGAGGLDAEEVVIWRVAVSREDARMEWARGWLSAGEMARAERVRPGVARDEFVLGRGLLRALLGEVMGGGVVEIEVRVNGKPRVVGGGGGFNVEFNVAHSGGVVLIALCRGAAVGVDVERVDRKVEAMEIAERNFAAGERRAIAQACEAERAREFFRIWTKKEAVVKAHGQGLTMGLESFDVSGGNGPVQAGGGMYFVRELAVGDGFAGAVAVQDGERIVRTVEPDAVLLRCLLLGGGKLPTV